MLPCSRGQRWVTMKSLLGGTGWRKVRRDLSPLCENASQKGHFQQPEFITRPREMAKVPGNAVIGQRWFMTRRMEHKKDGASPGASPTIFVTYVFLFLNWKRKRKTDSQRWKTLPHLPGQLPLITLISTKSPPQRSPPGIFPSLPVTPCSPHLMRYPWNSLITALLSG